MAIPGDRVYHDVARSVGQARDELVRVGTALEAARSEAESVRLEEIGCIAELAKFRLAELEAKRLVDGLDVADRVAVRLLDEKRAALQRVIDELAASEALQRELEAERDRARAERDDARAAHDGQIERTMERLAGTEVYESQRARVERAAEMAAHADVKAGQAQQDRVTKGRPYEQDRLFSYLWKRRYRFPEYRANRLIRALDAWVARLCGYDRAHRDYLLLLEIPKRLRAHAGELAEEAKREVVALQEIEDTALAEDGVPELAAALEACERALAEVEGRLDDEEQRYEELRAQRAAFEAGTDRNTSQAHSAIATQLEREDVATLRSDAARTGSRSDDQLVERIGALRARHGELDARAVELRSEHERALGAVRDLEEMQRRFRRSNYDSSDSLFDDDFDVGDLLGGLLRGAIVFGDAWRRVGRHHRFRRRRTSSTATSTAMDVIGSVLSSAMRSGGGSRGGFGGGFGGGGFRSGGGFGGGGFRTGGGF